ncbi:hypothetical protein MMC13_001738 [Lambiella insularis]|nr:hypothetical protein [Lambiella insularis]
MVVSGKTVKLIATPIGLASEAIHNYKNKKRSLSETTPQAALEAAAGEQADGSLAFSTEDRNNGQDPAYVTVPPDQAGELITSGQAVSAEGQEATHRLVPEDDQDDRVAGDETDWALDEAAENDKLQIAAGIDQEIQERWRTNKFFDQRNKEIFILRGLFAQLVTYKPDRGDNDRPEVGTKTIDPGAMAMAKYGDYLLKPEKSDTDADEQEKKKKMDEIKEKMKQVSIASGETHAEAEMPVTCAPLIFPALDTLAAAASAKEGGHNESVADSIKSKSKDTSKFMHKFYDRRAQAVYAARNPNSTLTSQVAPVKPEFKSRFADPNHATNRHSSSLITGGR